VKEWVVAGALIEGPQGVLLVANQRRDGSVDWTTPGGVVDPGETVIDGLTREVREETGLTVHAWEGPVYEIEALAPDMGWHLRVEVHRAVEVSGDLVVDDPDGIVVDACWVPGGDCGPRLAGSHRWVREPLVAWIDERWSDLRCYRYRIAGTDLRTLEVTAEP
jgi:8-oxo-dGTP diphosphatase